MDAFRNLLNHAAAVPIVPVNKHFKTQSKGWETCYRAMQTREISQNARRALGRWKSAPEVTAQVKEIADSAIRAAKAAEDSVQMACDELQSTLEELNDGTNNNANENAKITARDLTNKLDNEMKRCVQSAFNTQNLISTINKNENNLPSVVPGAETNRKPLGSGVPKDVTVTITVTWFSGRAIVSTSSSTEDEKKCKVSVQDNKFDNLRVKPYALAGKYAFETEVVDKKKDSVIYGGPWAYVDGQCRPHVLKYAYADVVSDKLNITLGGTSCHAYIASVTWWGKRYEKNNA